MDYSNYFWQGDKVRLRPLRVDDAEQRFVESLDSPSRQSLQLGTELPTSTEMLREFLAKYADCKDVDGTIIFAVETHEGVDVGGISLHGRHMKNGTFSLGLTIGRPHRMKGYAEDAARILLRYCFHEQRYQKCNSACIHTNEASIKLHEKLGFLGEGRRRRHLFFNGQYYDSVLFGLTREEFDENDSR
ncbi:MAG TPA: GNAT family protein [Acidobacteriota bacterium]|nr:GNAT family protein [Acidobacteriota bacterium]